MPRPQSLAVENLENREVPAVFGIPWNDARNLTISFVPDGTPIDGVQSNLFGALGGDVSAWQRQILRAVQSWAQNANINVSVVADSGAALGAAGASQGDPRFGDIRIAARPLSENVLAITAPSGFLGGTRAGDIVLNSNVQFSIDGNGSGPDLYSALLQEFGHALGIGNSTDPNSPMFEVYGGVRTGLTSGDIAILQSLYGARTKDAFDWNGGNETQSNARDLGAFETGGPASFAIRGDLTTNTDIDFYKIRTNDQNPNGLTIRISSVSSLLAPRISVLDSNGNVLDAEQSVDPLTGTLTINLASVQADAEYFVRIESANTDFSTGNYELRLIHDPNGPFVAADDGFVFDDALTDDAFAQAMNLSATDSTGRRFGITGNLRTGDVDFYRIQSPAGVQQGVLTIIARGLNAQLAARVLVYDSAQQCVQSQVLSNENGDYIIQIANTQANESYYLRVVGVNGTTGVYRLTAEFGLPLVNLTQIDAGTLTAARTTQFSTLTINRSQVMHFVLSAGAVPTGIQAGVQLGVFDSAGNVVTHLFAKAGQAISATVYLGVGNYTLRFCGLAPGSDPLPALDYSLKGISLTDPIAPVSPEPGTNQNGGTTTDPDFSWQRLADSVYALLPLQNLGGVIW